MRLKVGPVVQSSPGLSFDLFEVWLFKCSKPATSNRHDTRRKATNHLCTLEIVIIDHCKHDSPPGSLQLSRHLHHAEDDAEPDPHRHRFLLTIGLSKVNAERLRIDFVRVHTGHQSCYAS